jgi:transmembrane sensor
MSNKDSPDIRLKRHQEAVEWFFRLQTEDHSIEQTEQWIEWCTADPANQRAFEHLMPLWQARCAMPEQTVNALSTVSQLSDWAAARRGRLRQRWMLFAAAASIALVVLGILLYPHSANIVQLGAVAQLGSDIGRGRQAQLVDGSRIALGAQSQIAVNFAGTRREIEIQHGEALFTVQHDRTRPFIVSAGGLQVVAVGTVFDVDRRGSRVSVTVKEGVVEVSDSRTGVRLNAGPARVVRGQQLIFDPSGGEAPALRVVDPDSADAWRRGRFEYVSEPLSSVIEDLNRYSSEQIVLQDPALGVLRYSGTIEVAAIDEWLRALPNIFALHVQFSPEHRVTLSGPEATAN